MAGKITELGRSAENGERKNMGQVRGEKALLPFFFARRFLSYAPTSCHGVKVFVAGRGSRVEGNMSRVEGGGRG